MNTLPPEQKAADRWRGSVVTTQVFFTYANPVVLLIFLCALRADYLGRRFNFGLGAATKYSQVLAVTLYSALAVSAAFDFDDCDAVCGQQRRIRST